MESLSLNGSLYLQIDLVVASSEHLGGFFICTHDSYKTLSAAPAPLCFCSTVVGRAGLSQPWEITQ